MTSLQITDFIVEAADRYLVANAMMLDQSAAFDCMNANILDGELNLYNFSEDSRAWSSNGLGIC